MIPPTINKLPALACISAMQKCIRRGLEREAMEFAVELIHTSKPFCSMVCNRLEIIAHEDIDCIEQPWIVPMVKSSVEQAKEWHKLPNPGKCRMAIGNVIRMLCRAKKSRQGDHFQAAVGLSSLLQGHVPTIPDWAWDQHTTKGKAMGRGLEHFRTEGAKLHPPTEPDPYEDECYELWKLRDGRKESEAEPLFATKPRPRKATSAPQD